MKICLTSLTTEGMQIVTTIRNKYTPTKISKIKIVTPPNAGEEEEKLDHSYTVVGMQNSIATLEKSCHFLQKLNRQQKWVFQFQPWTFTSKK